TVVDEWAEATDLANASVKLEEEEKVVDEWAEANDVAYASVELAEVETVVDEWAEAEVETDHASDGEAVVECNVILGNQAILSDGEVLEVVAEFAENQLESADIAGEHIEAVTTGDGKKSKGVQGAIFADSGILEPVSEIVNDPSDPTRDMEETLVSTVTDGMKDVENSCDVIMDCEVTKNVEAVPTEIAREVVELVEKVHEECDHGEIVDGKSGDNVIDNVVNNMVGSVTEVEGDVEMEAVAAGIVTEVAEVDTSGVDEKLEGGDDGVVVCSDDVIEKVDVEIALVEVEGCEGEECGEVEEVSEMAEVEEDAVVMMTGAEISTEVSELVTSAVGEKFQSGDDGVVESCADVIKKADVEFGLVEVEGRKGEESSEGKIAPESGEEDGEIVMMDGDRLDSECDGDFEVEDEKEEAASESTISVGGAEETAIFKGGISLLGFKMEVQVICAEGDVKGWQRFVISKLNSWKGYAKGSFKEPKTLVGAITTGIVGLLRSAVNITKSLFFGWL
ncbi:hypothetical protein HDU76_008573, partial [Blyttiomyces sp. JEL0837]